MRSAEILLLDMLLSAGEACDFLSGISPGEFEGDRMRQLAVLKAIEVIGEAASKISETFRKAHSELPWRDIIGMRHRLIHGYFEVNLPMVWDTVHNDLPRMIALIRPLVPSEEE